MKISSSLVSLGLGNGGLVHKVRPDTGKKVYNQLVVLPRGYDGIKSNSGNGSFIATLVKDIAGYGAWSSFSGR